MTSSICEFESSVWGREKRLGWGARASNFEFSLGQVAKLKSLSPLPRSHWTGFSHSVTPEQMIRILSALEREKWQVRRAGGGKAVGVQIRIKDKDRPEQEWLSFVLFFSLLARVRHLVRAAKDPSLAETASRDALHAGQCEEKTPSAPVRRLCAPPSSERPAS